MPKIVNRAKMTVASAPGTGAVSLSAPASGFQSFSDAGVLNGDVISYVIEDGAAWEIGTGTYTASGPTLTRTPVQSSNSDGSAISASASATVYVTLLAQNAGISGPLKIDTSGGPLPVILSTPASVQLLLSNAAVSASNPIPVTTQGSVTVTGSVNATLTGTPTVALASNAVTATIQGTPSVNAIVQGTPTVTVSGPVALANGTSIATTETGFPYYVEPGTTGSIVGGSTVNGQTRATPQGGLQFIIKVFNPSSATFDLLLQGSADGSNWQTISTSGAFANAFTTATTDAVLPYYRGAIRLGGTGLSGGANLTTWFGRGSADIGPIIRQYGGGQVGITNPLWITSNSNFPVTLYQGSALASTSNPIPVQQVAPPNSMNGVGVLSTTTLGANAVFNSTVSTPTAGTVTTILASAASDQPGTFVIQGSATSIGPWYNVTPVTNTVANLATVLTAPILFANYRLIYTNGPTAQGVFYCSINYSRVGAC